VVAGTDSESCLLIVNFGISDVEPSGSTARESVTSCALHHLV
jgi:hypothetical protein